MSRSRSYFQERFLKHEKKNYNWLTHLLKGLDFSHQVPVGLCVQFFRSVRVLLSGTSWPVTFRQTGALCMKLLPHSEALKRTGGGEGAKACAPSPPLEVLPFTIWSRQDVCERWHTHTGGRLLSSFRPLCTICKCIKKKKWWGGRQKLASFTTQIKQADYKVLLY